MKKLVIRIEGIEGYEKDEEEVFDALLSKVYAMLEEMRKEEAFFITSVVSEDIMEAKG